MSGSFAYGFRGLTCLLHAQSTFDCSKALLQILQLKIIAEGGHLKDRWLIWQGVHITSSSEAGTVASRDHLQTAATN
jgi:hypothetical protein